MDGEDDSDGVNKGESGLVSDTSRKKLGSKRNDRDDDGVKLDKIGDDGERLWDERDVKGVRGEGESKLGEWYWEGKTGSVWQGVEWTKPPDTKSKSGDVEVGEGKHVW